MSADRRRRRRQPGRIVAEVRGVLARVGTIQGCPILVGDPGTDGPEAHAAAMLLARQPGPGRDTALFVCRAVGTVSGPIPPRMSLETCHDCQTAVWLSPQARAIAGPLRIVCLCDRCGGKRGLPYVQETKS